MVGAEGFEPPTLCSQSRLNHLWKPIEISGLDAARNSSRLTDMYQVLFWFAFILSTRLTHLHFKLVEAHADGRDLYGLRKCRLLGLNDFDHRLSTCFISGIHAGRRDLV